MAVHTMAVTVRSSAQTSDAVVVQSRTRPPLLLCAALLADEPQGEVYPIRSLLDKALQAIPNYTLPAEHIAQMDALIALHQEGAITAAQPNQRTALHRNTEILIDICCARL